MSTISEKQKNTYDALKEQFGYENVMQTPNIEKVVVSIGVGKETDKNRIKRIKERIALITGQEASETLAKQSIAQFKLREGTLAGYKTTLRGEAMWNFLEKLISVALPRTRDFRGISNTSVDAMGNYTLGLKENAIFPETADEDVRTMFGMAITVVTSGSDAKETQAYLEHLGFPFKKVEEKA